MGKVHNINKNQKKEERTAELAISRCLRREFSEAIKALQAMPMKPSGAMKVKRATLIIYNEMQSYVKKRTEIFEKYSERDENGGIVFEDEAKTQYKVAKENEDAAMAELNELYERKFKIPVTNVDMFYGDAVTPEFLGILDGIILESPNA